MSHARAVVSEASAPRDDGTRALTRPIEAILLTSERAVTARRLAEALGLVAPESGDAPDGGPPDTVGRGRERADGAPADLIRDAVEHLNREYAATGRTFRIETVSGGYRLMTLPDVAPALAAFHRAAPASRLSRAAVETLAIVAYRQPITRAQLEAIRGVSCGEVLRSLMERRLVTIRGRAEELGRPILYGTTKEFLDAFGLSALKDLPSPAESLVGGA
jgi:segregation and condensation protein B